MGGTTGLWAFLAVRVRIALYDWRVCYCRRGEYEMWQVFVRSMDCRGSPSLNRVVGTVRVMDCGGFLNLSEALWLG